MLVAFESFSHGVASYAARTDLVVETLGNDAFRFHMAPTFHLPFPLLAVPPLPSHPGQIVLYLDVLLLSLCLRCWACSLDSIQPTTSGEHLLCKRHHFCYYRDTEKQP